MLLKSARVSITYAAFKVMPVMPLSLGLAVLFNRELVVKNPLAVGDLHARRNAGRGDGGGVDVHDQQDGVMNTIRSRRQRPDPLAAQQRERRCGP